ncbi:MAG: hypothetical protein LBR22_00765 [Desulfovibrio sp.]|jgi:hypothetical protein|nr:hypothetical protein [Desulfovibrio sp.]
MVGGDPENMWGLESVMVALVAARTGTLPADMPDSMLALPWVTEALASGGAPQSRQFRERAFRTLQERETVGKTESEEAS